LLDQKLTTMPQHQWVSKLFGFDFSVEYKLGTANVITDALSQRDTKSSVPVLALSAPSFHLFDDLRQEFNGSQESCAFWDAVDKGERGDN
jgi:hypothetical protein